MHRLIFAKVEGRISGGCDTLQRWRAEIFKQYKMLVKSQYQLIISLNWGIVKTETYFVYNKHVNIRSGLDPLPTPGKQPDQSYRGPEIVY